MSHIPEPDTGIYPVPHFTPCSSEHFLKVKPRYSATLTQLPRKSVTRNSLKQSISIYLHPQYSATNCGVQIVALYRDMTVVFI